MTALNSYTGPNGPNGGQGASGNTSHPNGYPGGPGGPGYYALNIGGTNLGTGNYLPPGPYTASSGVNISGGNGGNGGTGGTGGYYSGIFGIGGAGGKGGTGSEGVDLSASALGNSGQLTGGHGGNGGTGGSYVGGFALFGGTGGTGGGGGAGVDLLSGTLTNYKSGHITGGAGGAGGNGNGGYDGNTAGNGGAAGAGVSLSSGALTNSGSITGGNGGTGGNGTYGGHGANGGAGGSLLSGTLTNNKSGQINGGAGGTGGNGTYGGHGGNGGAGAYLNGGTLITSGEIGQGAAGPGHFNGVLGDAVQFGAVASVLEVKPGAFFIGQVAANAAVNDVLKLSGTQDQGMGPLITPITLGGQFTGFSTLTFVSGAAWTVDVTIGAASSSPGMTVGGFTTSDVIDVMNLGPTAVAADFNSTTHVLTLPGDGTLDFSGSFSGETFVFSSDESGNGTDITVMKGSVISQTVTTTVTVGSKLYPSPLTITSTGKVAPSLPGATAVVSSQSNNSVTNEGTIQGAAGGVTSSGAGITGGLGVNLKAGAVTNTGSITGGAGGQGSTTGGHGGAGVELNGGTLITSGTISGGFGGMGATDGALGDAVKFGTVASTLVIEPGAVFNGQVVGNASVHDVLELSGTQAGGTAITLGTQFTNFSVLEFAPGATGTVDASVSDLTNHPLSAQGSIVGFGLGDTLDIGKLVHAGMSYSFDATHEILTITKGATVIQLGFDSPFTGDHFVLASDGHGGTDVTLQAGAALEPMALHGFSSQAFIEHDLAHDAHVMIA